MKDNVARIPASSSSSASSNRQAVVSPAASDVPMARETPCIERPSPLQRRKIFNPYSVKKKLSSFHVLDDHSTRMQQSCLEEQFPDIDEILEATLRDEDFDFPSIDKIDKTAVDISECAESTSKIRNESSQTISPSVQPLEESSCRREKSQTKTSHSAESDLPRPIAPSFHDDNEFSDVQWFDEVDMQVTNKIVHSEIYGHHECARLDENIADSTTTSAEPNVTKHSEDTMELKTSGSKSKVTDIPSLLPSPNAMKSDPEKQFPLKRKQSTPDQEDDFSSEVPNIRLKNDLNLPYYETLGELRKQPAVSFSWQGSSLGYRQQLGRVYYSGFVRNGQTFLVGEHIHIPDPYFRGRIASVFQATKSFLGRWYNDRQEIQKRGHPYMELVRLDGQLERIPDWILQPNLKILREKASNESALALLQSLATAKWHHTLRARQVEFTRHPKQRTSATRLQVVFHDGSDDDSHASDGDSYRSQDNCDLVTGTTKPHNRYEWLKTVKVRKGLQVGSDFSLPPPQLVVVDESAEPWQDDGDDLDDEENDSQLRHILQETSKEGKLEGKAIDVMLELWDARKRATVLDRVEFVESFASHVSLEVERCRTKLGYPSFKVPQGQVCQDLIEFARAPMAKDLFFLAPCGFGKSLCFAVAHQVLGKLTIVVEPLRAIIETQMRELSAKGISVEKLLTEQDARAKKQAKACDRLCEMMHSKPSTILFSTPELLSSCLDSVPNFAGNCPISFIVIDEFDYIKNATSSYRSAYLDLVTKLRRNWAESVPFLFLAGTARSNDILRVLPTHCVSKPLLYQIRNPIADNLVFRVERKISQEQVAHRIAAMVKLYGQDGDDAPGFLCFCQTRSECDTMQKRLGALGIKASMYVGEDKGDDSKRQCTIQQSNADRTKTLNDFENGNIQAICATAAMGRGVHLKRPIRFVFHPVLPASLSEYVQECGRAGRDGVESFCILFYRHEDESVVFNLKLFNSAKNADEQSKVRRLTKRGLREVEEYSFLSDTCRLVHLALRITPLSHAANYTCGMRGKRIACDNCAAVLNFPRGQLGGNVGFERIEITELFLRIAYHMQVSRGKEKTSTWIKHALSLAVGALDSQKEALAIMMYCTPHADADRSILLNCLRRYYKSILESGRQLAGKKFFLRIAVDEHSPSVAAPLPKDRIEHQIKKIEVITHADRTENLPWHTLCYKRNVHLPFCLQFETKRLVPEPIDLTELEHEYRKERPSTKMTYDLLLNKFLGKRTIQPPGMHDLEEAYFSCRLDPTGSLVLLEPQIAFGKRIFREFGAHRFLEIRVAENVPQSLIIELASKPLQLCGRSFSYLWCKNNKSPQQFIFFAERGVGLDEEIRSIDVLCRCIPRNLNQQLTISQLAKRVKLSFSTTVATSVLPPASTKLLPNFKLENFNEIDGCGLISRAALNAIWRNYCAHREFPEYDECCPYSGFQGRLGGFKGTWLVDDGLSAHSTFAVECRESQMKYSTPQNCLDPVLDPDTFYNTIEVCSFDEKHETQLNIRFIQILEHLAELAGKRDEFEDFMLDCVGAVIEEFEKINSGTMSSELRDLLCSQRSRMHCKELAVEKDGTSLYRMTAASVNGKEPEFSRIRARLVRKRFERIRDKAHYPLAQCCDVRMYADHTFLLQEGEAYLAVQSAKTATEIVAARNPAYFSGDVRRLKLVSLETIISRASCDFRDGVPIPDVLKRTRSQKQLFFSGLKDVLVLSNKGSRSEADRMSGGDYDGDRAFVCWNERLLSLLPSNHPAEHTADLRMEKSKLEAQNAWQSSRADHLAFMLHFRSHQRMLGTFSELLDVAIDVYGFDDERTREIGRSAFFQVDMPFHPYKLQGGVSLDAIRSLGWPDWKNRNSKSYVSSKILGLMWRTLKAKMKEGRESSYEVCPEIMEFIQNAEKDNAALCKELAETMETAAKRFGLEKTHFQSSSARTAEEYYSWRDSFCARSRKELIMTRHKASVDPSKLAAAILYKCCMVLEEKQEVQHATEFAWSVALDELCSLFSGPGKVELGREMESYFLLQKRSRRAKK